MSERLCKKKKHLKDSFQGQKKCVAHGADRYVTIGRNAEEGMAEQGIGKNSGGDQAAWKSRNKKGGDIIELKRVGDA